MNNNKNRDGKAALSLRMAPRWAWLMSGIATAALITLEMTGQVGEGVIDAVAAATQVQTPAPPTLTVTGSPALSQNAVQISEGQTVTLNIHGVDPATTGYNTLKVGTVSGNVLYWSQKNPSLPAGASFTLANGDPTTGQFTWTPPVGTASQTPSVPIKFGVLNTYWGTSATRTIAINIAAAANNPPTLTITPAGSQQTVVEGGTLLLSVSATDPDGNMVTLSAAPLPAGASFDPATGLFKWTPAQGTAATTPQTVVTFQATDTPANGIPSLSTTYPMTIMVAATSDGANQAPVLLPIATPQTVSVGETLTLRITAADADDDSLSFTAAPLPAGAAFTPEDPLDGAWTGVFTWTPTADRANRSYPVTFTVQDDYATPAQAAQTVTFNVVSASAGGGSVKKLSISQAQWKANTSSLLVQGNVKSMPRAKVKGLSVILTDADSGAEIGTAAVKGNKLWQFKGAPATGNVPCQVRAEIDGKIAARTVKRAPAGVCSP
jgi:hypothetical protein